MRQTNGLMVGFLVLGCAGAVPSETASTEPGPAPPIISEPCPLSAPRSSSARPRVFVELATLQGDLAAIRRPSNAAGQVAEARTFSQLVADPRWKAISVRHVLGNDGIAQTFPWEFDPPRASAPCPASERWDIGVTPYVIGLSPVTIRVDVRIKPAPAPGAAPDASQVTKDCGAETTVVLRDQELIVIPGFPPSAGAGGGLVTTLTPYVIWDDADLRRLAECKSLRVHTDVTGVQAVPPQTPSADAR